MSCVYHYIGAAPHGRTGNTSQLTSVHQPMQASPRTIEQYEYQEQEFDNKGQLRHSLLGGGTQCENKYEEKLIIKCLLILRLIILGLEQRSNFTLRRFL